MIHDDTSVAQALTENAASEGGCSNGAVRDDLTQGPPGADDPPDVGTGRVVGRLTAAEYWEWRTTVAEMRTADVEYELAQSRSGLLKRDVEIAHLKAQLHIMSVEPAMQAKAEAARAEYEATKARLEKAHGFSMKNAVIDETFAVRVLEDSAQS